MKDFCLSVVIVSAALGGVYGLFAIDNYYCEQNKTIAQRCQEVAIKSEQDALNSSMKNAESQYASLLEFIKLQSAKGEQSVLVNLKDYGDRDGLVALLKKDGFRVEHHSIGRDSKSSIKWYKERKGGNNDS